MGGRGATRSELTSTSVVRTLERSGIRDPHTETQRRRPAAFGKLTGDEHRLESRAGGNCARELWTVGIRAAVLSRTGDGETGAAQAAAICW